MAWTRKQLARRSARFYWRHHLVTALAVALCAAVLTGALMVGQAMRGSLEKRRVERLGQVAAALFTADRFFRRDLAAEVGAVPAVRLMGSVATGDRRTRVHQVQVLAVPEAFFALGPSGAAARPEPGAETTSARATINRRLADRLGAEVGDPVLLRFANPSALPREAVFSSDEDATVAMPFEIAAILEPEQFGDFALEANPTPPYNVFVELDGPLPAKIDREGQANLLLAGEPFALAGRLTLEDLELKVDPAGTLKSERVFLDPAVEALAAASGRGHHPVITYFVNEMAAGTNRVPYSMVTATDLVDVPEGGIVIDDWAAAPEDLAARTGDTVRLSYYTLGEARTLIERTNAFTVTAIMPKTEALAQDNLLATEFPGFEDKENCRDWDPNLPVDVKRIRDRDEEYWDAYGTSPKAFVNLAEGQRLWENAYGRLTGIRFDDKAGLAEALAAELDPAAFGFVVRDLAAEGRRSAAGTMNFGGLFLAMSWFLMLAAILLAVLQVGFGLDYRAGELELLRTLGFAPARARGLVLLELLAVLGIGAIGGALLGYVYLNLVIRGLRGGWGAADAGGLLQPTGREWIMIGVGAATVTLILVAVLWRGVGKQVRRESRPVATGRRRAGALVFAGLFGAGLIALGLGRPSDPDALPGYFAGLGMMALGLGVALFAWSLRGGRARSLTALARRNLARRPWRSLAVAGMLAAGAYLVFSTGVFKRGEDERGTGGFALIGQSTQPIYRDLNTPEGREATHLDGEVFSNGVRYTQIRVSQGVEASCVNLQAATQPVVAGVRPSDFADRFEIVKGEGWEALDRDLEGGVVPAIGDLNALMWALHKQVGDEIDVGQGRVRVVGAVNHTVLQGYLVVSERHFRALFPDRGGWQMFFVDAPEAARAELAAELTRTLREQGMELRPATERLAELNAVQNAYIDIFQTLGGLGVMLGCLGLGILCLRSVLERRHELAVQQAVGFGRARLLRMLVLEQGGLLVAGLLIGSVAGLLAVVPFARFAGGDAWPSGLFWVLLGGVALGLGSVLFAVCWFLRQPVTDNLRAE